MVMDEATKSEIQVLLAAMQQESDAKLAAQEAKLLKEFDTQANKIHSSYAKQLKKAGINTAQADDEEEDSPNRKPTKKELEMQANIEKLVREGEEAKAKAKDATQKQTVIDHLIKSGYKPEAVDTVYKIFRADNLISEDADGNLLLKVQPINSQAKVSLPITDALKHYAQSAEGKNFVPPLGAQGTGAKETNPTKTTNATDNGGNKRGSRNVIVNWEAVSQNQLSEQQGTVADGDGSFAPRFETK